MLEFINYEKKIILLVFLTILPFIQGVYGQFNVHFPIKIYGVVFERDSLTPLPNVHYRIDSRHIKGLTNTRGQFVCDVTVDDTLKFTFIGYKEAYFVVKDTQLPGEYIVGIILSRDTILLQEVVVIPRKRNLRQDLMSIETPSGQDLENARRNLKISAYQGISGIGVVWDSDKSYELQTMKINQEAMNKGMVPQNQMIAINFLAGIPYMIYLLGKKEDIIRLDDIFITDMEYKKLLESCRKLFYIKTIPNDSTSVKQ